MLKESEAVVNSGIISIQPLSIYAFPLKYNNKLLGVVEVLFTYEITKRYIEFLDEAGKIISIALNNNLQNDKIRFLFDETDKGKK